MDITLDYGHHGLTVTLPDHAQATIIRKPAMTLPESADAEIDRALAAPIGCDLLETLAAKARSACIVICDITRPVPNRLFLRKLIQRMMASGIPADAITVLVATGLHRPNLGDELAELIGDPWVQETVRVINHDARDDTAHISLGRTRKHDCPVALDRLLVEADLKIATGLVEPHFMAGYSGGRKVISPGVAHHETIRTFHSARFMEHPAATSCNLDGNPLHETQLEIVDLLNARSDLPVLALNTVLDEARNLAHATFGEIIASHEAAVAYARASCEVPVGGRFQTVASPPREHSGQGRSPSDGLG